MKKPVILIADDHTDFRESIADILLRTGLYNVIEAINGGEALRQFQQNSDVDCVLLDYHMPHLNGLEVAERLSILAPHIPIIIFSSYDGKPKGWVREKADIANLSYVSKNLEEVLQAVENSVYTAPEIIIDESIAKELRSIGFVFESAGMRDVVQKAVQAAHSDANLLITGETGVGKTVLAAIVHQMSGRAHEPFIQFKCSGYAANKELFSSNVFGHAKGAYSGALNDKESIFYKAGKGTLFLDEISEIPTEAQATLLGALDEKKYQRIGENIDRLIECRIISATNRELNSGANGSQFREDLRARINQKHIHIPPLRERPEDIQLLVQKYLTDFANSGHGRPLRIEPNAIGYLRRQSWPRNTRQLQSIIGRAIDIAPHNSITIADLARELKTENMRAPQTRIDAPIQFFPDDMEALAEQAPRSSDAEIDAPRLEIMFKSWVRATFDNNLATTLKEDLEVLRKLFIEESLRRTKGNVKKAEREFWGYSSSGKGGLMYWVNKFGIDPGVYKD